MSIKNNPFLIVGHRGAAGEKLENSLDGFRHSLTLDIDAVELDIREHKEQLWVFHDAGLERVTGSTGPFEAHPDPARVRLNNGETVPTLTQVLDLYWGKMPVNIEIKSLARLQLLLDLLAGYPALPAQRDHPWILISSFDHEALLKLKALDCPWPLAPISDDIPRDIDRWLDRLAPWSWHFDDDHLDLDQLACLRERGVTSLVFTVNDPERARYLKQVGVSGIFTDIPSEMLRVL